jgi:voltage-gated potassium channel
MVHRGFIMLPRHKFFIAMLLLFFVLSLGTLGYRFLEGWTLLESLYMTVITLTTVGYAEVHPISLPETRLFTILLIFSGMGVVFYTLGALTQSLVEGQIRDVIGRRKVKRHIQTLKNHCIVCGFGRIGQSICHELSLSKVPFVVIEKEVADLEMIEQEGYLGVLGDATSEETLRRAGIERARSLIPVASTDADNLYITLTARGINPGVFIVARAAGAGADQKLLWAGADRVVSPYKISGRRMANMLLRPHVVEFIEGSLYDPSMEIVMEEIHLEAETSFINKSLQSTGLRRDYGISVVAIQRKEGKLLVNPGPDVMIQEGDCLIALGQRQDFNRVSSVLGGSGNRQA